jgi:NAD kinase
MLFDRSLVLEATTEVRLRVSGHRFARLSVDGRDGGLLNDGDSVICTAARHPARLVTFGGHDVFHEVLRSKFHLADR